MREGLRLTDRRIHGGRHGNREAEKQPGEQAASQSNVEADKHESGRE